ncbi:MAG: SDR family oxidoreductase [Aigarchaeota archaeon]|nr:SDR family oxidoreductase [Aigarchaeota archaeon]
MKLRDRVAIITGGASGMGFAMASKFASEGAKVAIIDIAEDKAEEAAQKIRSEGGDALAFQGDVTSRGRIEEIVSEVIRKFGKIDILVNNVGIYRGKPFWEESLDIWELLFRVNVLGIVIPSQAVVPHMMERRSGVILNISSKAAIVGEPGHAAYSASKGAVLSLTRAMAVELAPYNIRVNAICPGPTETPLLFATTTEEDRKRMASRCILGRLAKPEDIANAALYLVSDDSNYVTGQALIVDGGMTITAVERF